MPIFEDREHTFERRFARDQERAFRIAARRNHLVALWAARHMGLLGEHAEQYAQRLMADEMLVHGNQPVLERLMADLIAAGVRVHESEVRAELRHCASLARAEIEQS